MNRHSFLLTFLVFNTFFSSVSAQVIVPSNVAKNIESWIGVPAEYLGSPKDIIIFAVIPFVLASLLAHSLWKEIGVINNDTLNFWLPVMLVFASFQFGFFKFVKALYANTQSLVFAGVAIFAFLITAKIRHRVSSFGYSGMFSGVLGYAFDAIGLGIFFGGVTGALTGGRMGPLVYAMFFVGAGLGIFLIWLSKREKKSTTKIDVLLGQEEDIEKKIAHLEQKRNDLYDETAKMTKDEDKLAKLNEMAMIQREIEILKAKRGVVESGLERAA